jgi:hypothetical protein
MLIEQIVKVGKGKFLLFISLQPKKYWKKPAAILAELIPEIIFFATYNNNQL